MSKLVKTIMKNYKILFRNRDSAAVVILGPLAIILLVGLAFNNSQSFDVKVGIIVPDDSALTGSFVTKLEERYLVTPFLSKELCIDKIKAGETHICVVFPSDFQIENNKVNNVTLYVDNTRQNLVFQVIETIKENVRSSSSDISLNLTTDLLSAIKNTQTQTSTNIAKVLLLKSEVDIINADNNQVVASANSINLQSGDISLTGVKTMVEGLRDEIGNLDDVADDVTQLDSDYTVGGNFTEDLDAIVAQLDDIENASDVDITAAIASIDAVGTSIEEFETSITIANQAKSNINTKSNNIKTKIATVKTELDQVKSGLEFIQAQIDAITVTDAESIVNPVNTNIESVVTENSRLVFLFPMLLVLIIMFASLLLSSTLIVLEKRGRAFFRNFTTSTKDEVFIISTFLTSFLMVLAQSILVMGVALIFLKTSLPANYGTAIFVVFLTVSLFVMIGMAIGYSLNSQQSANMVSISFASVFLLLSNFILPIEAVAPALQVATKFNPFMIASETLRKALLFNAGFFDIDVEIGFLFLYSVLILIIILMTHKLSKIRYLGIITHKKLKVTSVGEGNSFDIGEEFIVRTKEELYVAFVKIDDTDFENYIVRNKKEFLLWIKEGLRDPSLARKIRRMNREQTLTYLERVIDKKKLPHSKEFEEKQAIEKKRRAEQLAFEPEESNQEELGEGPEEKEVTAKEEKKAKEEDKSAKKDKKDKKKEKKK